MLIESIIRRKDGTGITFNDGSAYHFAPDAQGRHVCHVENQAHIQRFLSITEGYREVPVEQTPVESTDAQDVSIESTTVELPKPTKPKRRR